MEDTIHVVKEEVVGHDRIAGGYGILQNPRARLVEGVAGDEVIVPRGANAVQVDSGFVTRIHGVRDNGIVVAANVDGVTEMGGQYRVALDDGVVRRPLDGVAYYSDAVVRIAHGIVFDNHPVSEADEDARVRANSGVGGDVIHHGVAHNLARGAERDLDAVFKLSVHESNPGNAIPHDRCVHPSPVRHDATAVV